MLVIALTAALLFAVNLMSIEDTEAQSPSDDHGDSLEDATPIEVNRRTAGHIETKQDLFDVFSFKARKHHSYSIVLAYGTLSSARVGLYQSSGQRIVEDYSDIWIDGVAPSSGTYYIAVEGIGPGGPSGRNIRGLAG